MANKKSYYTKAEFKILPKDVKDQEFNKLLYDYSQNLKMPFIHYILRPRQIIITIVVFFLTYIYVEPNKGLMDFLILFMKYYIVALFIPYKFFTNLKYEDILLNPDEK